MGNCLVKCIKTKEDHDPGNENPLSVESSYEDEEIETHNETEGLCSRSILKSKYYNPSNASRLKNSKVNYQSAFRDNLQNTTIPEESRLDDTLYKDTEPKQQNNKVMSIDQYSNANNGADDGDIFSIPENEDKENISNFTLSDSKKGIHADENNITLSNINIAEMMNKNQVLNPLDSGVMVGSGKSKYSMLNTQRNSEDRYLSINGVGADPVVGMCQPANPNQTQQSANIFLNNRFGKIPGGKLKRSLSQSSCMLNKKPTQVGFLNFYFEFIYLMIFNKEELISTYPDLNLFIKVEINDLVNTQEKLYMQKKEESKDFMKYVPMLKKDDIKYGGYRFTREVSTTIISFSRPIKLQISIGNYYRDKFVWLSEETIYFNYNQRDEYSKFRIYQNMQNPIETKKMATVLFAFQYHLAQDQTQLSKFPMTKNLALYKADHNLIFQYYGKENTRIQPKNSKDFSSIKDIEESKLYLNILIFS